MGYYCQYYLNILIKRENILKFLEKIRNYDQGNNYGLYDSNFKPNDLNSKNREDYKNWVKIHTKACRFTDDEDDVYFWDNGDLSIKGRYESNYWGQSRMFAYLSPLFEDTTVEIKCEDDQRIEWTIKNGEFICIYLSDESYSNYEDVNFDSDDEEKDPSSRLKREETRIFKYFPSGNRKSCEEINKNGNILSYEEFEEFLDKDYEDKIITDVRIKLEKRYKNGVLHNEGGKPAIIEYQDGKPYKKVYYHNGILKKDYQMMIKETTFGYKNGKDICNLVVDLIF